MKCPHCGSEFEEELSNRRIVETGIHILDILAAGFIGVAIYASVQGNYSTSLGLLGPALVALVGAVGFRHRLRHRGLKGGGR